MVCRDIICRHITTFHIGSQEMQTADKEDRHFNQEATIGKTNGLTQVSHLSNSLVRIFLNIKFMLLTHTHIHLKFFKIIYLKDRMT